MFGLGDENLQVNSELFFANRRSRLLQNKDTSFEVGRYLIGPSKKVR
jgi:hypothetical protein